MTFDELALAILRDLIAKSGVREWEESSEWRAQLTGAAVEMAAQIYLGVLPMANAIYEKTGSSVVFGSEVTDDVDWSTEAIANGAGRQSAQWDRGADGTARPGWYRYRFYTQAQATPTLGATCRLYLKTSDGTHADNDDGTGDAAVSAEDKLRNLDILQPAIVDEAAANIEYSATGIVHITARYVQAVLWNAMGSAVTNDAAETKLVLTETFPEVQ